MSYASIGILAIIVHVIIHKDVIWKQGEHFTPSMNAYRAFLFGVLVYYITDALWGILDGQHLIPLLFADTSVYFVAMTTAVLLWTRYVIIYLEEKNAFGRLLSIAGVVFCVFGVAIVIVNLFVPILFWFDLDGTYQAAPVRYLLFGIQIIMFLLASVHTVLAMRKDDASKRSRHLAICFFGFAMTVLIVVQILYPLLPLYSVGYMIGGCLLHAFVVEGERKQYRRELEETLERERQREAELGSARRLVNTDPLTGVKSKHAYIEMESDLNDRIMKGSAEPFALVVFDLNGLKSINDTKGHEAGDLYIKDACRLICNIFKHSPVYRIGGDEFIAILHGEDFEGRDKLMKAFDVQVEDNIAKGDVVVSAGMADYTPGQNADYWTVFELADARMYHRKKTLKDMGATTR